MPAGGGGGGGGGGAEKARALRYKYPLLTCDAGSAGYRAKRICDMIEAGPGGGRNHTVQSMAAIQLDYRSYLFQDLRPVIASLTFPPVLGEPLREQPAEGAKL